MANQFVSTGIPIAPTTGSAQLIRAGGGQLLGFFSGTAGAVTIYDAASTSNLPTAKLTATTTTVGWYAFPMEFINGLVVNVAAATTFIIQ